MHLDWARLVSRLLVLSSRFQTWGPRLQVESGSAWKASSLPWTRSYPGCVVSSNVSFMDPRWRGCVFVGTYFSCPGTRLKKESLAKQTHAEPLVESGSHSFVPKSGVLVGKATKQLWPWGGFGKDVEIQRTLRWAKNWGQRIQSSIDRKCHSAVK